MPKLLLRKYITKMMSGTVEQYGENTADARLLSNCQSKVKGLHIASFLNDFAHKLGIIRNKLAAD